MTTAKAKGKRRERMAAKAVRDDMRQVLDRVEFGGERIVITRHERDSAALISVAELEKLEARQNVA